MRQSSPIVATVLWAVATLGCGGKVFLDESGGAAECVDTQSDPENCGYCGHDCRGGACTAGLCPATVLAAGQPDPNSIAVDTTRVFWTSLGDGSVREVPIEGGTPAALASEQSAPGKVAVNTTGVYWLQNNTWVMTLPFGANQPETLLTATVGPMGMTVDELSVYAGLDGTLVRLPAAGGVPAPLVKAFALDIAVDASGGCWTDCSAGGVFEVPIAGGEAVMLASAQECPIDIATNTTSVFWTNYLPNGGPVLRTVPRSGGDVVTLGPDRGALAADADAVYFVVDGTVKRLSAGGDAVILASGQNPVGLAVDDRNVYWVNADSAPGAGDGSVMKVPK